jgi:hypothetical protein
MSATQSSLRQIFGGPGILHLPNFLMMYVVNNHQADRFEDPSAGRAAKALLVDDMHPLQQP